MSKTKVVCPQCGAEFAIPGTTHLSVGIAIGADSNLGVIHPPVVGQITPTRREDRFSNNLTPKQMKAEAKIEALRKAGINVNNLFSMKGADGTETIARLDNGNLTIVPDNDPIFTAIMNGGTVNNPRLFRRWVMAQVFHMLATNDFIGSLQKKGYAYQWKMLVEELRVQAKLCNSDPENFKERNRFFNKKRVVEIAMDYINKLSAHIANLPEKHCKGVPYVRLKGGNYFVTDIANKVMKKLLVSVDKIRNASNPQELYWATTWFWLDIKKLWLNRNIQMASDFKDSYKGAGAYYTMKNMILFHGCKFRAPNGRFLSQAKSMEHLDEKAEEYSQEGWRLFGVMKKLLKDNNINIQKKIAEWRK